MNFFNAITDNLIPIILGCIIFLSVYWMADNVDNPKANPYAYGGTLNPIEKIDTKSKRDVRGSAARNNRLGSVNISSNTLLFDL